MRRIIQTLAPLVVAVAALVGFSSSLTAPAPVSHASVIPPSGTTAAVPTPAAVVLPAVTRTTAAITTSAPAAGRPQPATVEAPALPAVDQWHAIFNDMAAQLPGTYRIGEPAGCDCWGVTPHDSDTVWVSPRTPVARVADVMRHESGHIRMTRVYGSASRAYEALKAHGGWEAVADCIARQLGARWTNYVRSCTAAMTTAARAILNGVIP